MSAPARPGVIRFNPDLLDDPAVQRLSPEEFKAAFAAALAGQPSVLAAYLRREVR